MSHGRLAALVLLGGCCVAGGRAREAAPEDATGGEGVDVEAAALEPAARAEPDPEPAPLRVGHGLVFIEQRELAAGASIAPPVSRCQDVLVFVREGELALFDGHIRASAGHAARFSPAARGEIKNLGDVPASVVMFTTRHSMFPFAAGAEAAEPPDDERCAPATTATEAAEPGPHAVDAATVPPLVLAGGKLRVRILLDAGHGAHHAGLSILEAAADAVVPEHIHAGSDEVLLIEQGHGAMRLGTEELEVRDGQTVQIPARALHDFRGAGDRPLRALQLYAPSGPEQRFRQLASEQAAATEEP